ncbi:MAG: hypothetical protein Q9207_002267 [Kuettlingeria erythrocarpa]
MDVTRYTFQHQLPSLIAAIADAHFVAFDLELSGIPGKQANKLRLQDDSAGGKPSLQQRYEETKKAAEEYQVLQLGLTCVGENRDRGVYVIRPYNIFLNPVPEEIKDVERIFSYQSGAVEFLMKHDFRMEAPFLEGVQYFSRAEEATARLLATQRQNKTSIGDMQIKPDDVAAIELIERLREEVVAWKNRTTPMPDFMNFTASGFDPILHPDRVLNSFQRRLVHQYIKTEHPDLVTITRQGFMQIVAYDKEQEDANQRYRNRVFDEKIVKQVGLRWIVEAICGGDLSAINPYNFHTTVKSRQEKAAADFIRIREQLMGNSTVLVGHNLFLDLIYFHACFFGPLPDKVEDFQRAIHDLFPRIIDTKYLATHNISDPVLADSSLEKLDERLSKQEEPSLELHPEHPKYALAKPAHEAGFDSYLTAKVLIRLSGTLEKSGWYLDEKGKSIADNEDYYTPDEGHSPERRSSGESSGGVSIYASSVPKNVAASGETSKSSSAQSKYTPTTDRSTFANPTVFDLLGDIPADDDLATLTLQPQQSDQPVSKKQAKRDKRAQAEMGKRMPAWESSFWDVYGNKLRVNGTAEGVCDVGFWPYQDGP